MIEYDLHIHTDASDGLLTPEKVFEIAKTKGLKGISITDHDTVSAITKSKYLSASFGIDFIPGIELSCDYSGLEVHILGYYIDNEDKNLNNFLSKLQSSRFERSKRIVDTIRSLGFNISYEEVEKEAGSNYKSLGRPHIGRVLVNKGYYKDLAEVFDKLLNRGKPGYIERYKVSVNEGIEKIKEWGGIPVIAHPMIIEGIESISDIESFIVELKEYGALGIEVYHSLQSSRDSELLYEIAERHNMIITGGSDCHGICSDNEYTLGSYGVDSNKVLKLKSLKR